ncbi:DUF6879 family protein [Spirillospora sp. NPDC048911]|uniref:DUF6879 family protein n=1 Tax=Spirillospora sp. NPDC048911 TaxID=3364527 RepID=UPI003720B5FB
MQQEKTFAELFASTVSSAVHLEMRDHYTPDDPSFVAWQAGRPVNIVEHEREWFDLVSSTVRRGVTIRRARIVSEPLADFPRFEHECTEPLNITAGEQVRWLPRRQASDLALPGNDFWVFDDRLVRFGFFSGPGDYLGSELTMESAVVKLCASAFEAVWERAIPHQDYRPA